MSEGPARTSTTKSPPRRLDVVAKHPRDAAADVPGLVARANVTFETVGDLSAVLARSCVHRPFACRRLVAGFVREFHPLDAELDLGGDDPPPGGGHRGRGSARDFGRGLSRRAFLATSAVPSAEEARGDARAPSAPST